MEYLAFALKYRPKSLEEVVGQAHVTASLGNAILKQRVHHAYLFSGPRGVGKTSLARILAKSLNCQQGPTVKPCNVCDSCVSIAKGSSLDIIEIDGASNRGIDEIRTLRENVKLSTAGGRFKIYIIDEVHMLTQEAFNALLKTLEEPPPHVKFIFATTHPHKVLPTILSRCQKFQFNLLSLEDVVAKLKKIVKAENLNIEDSLLHTIGCASGGSIRDAESLLDQLVPVLLENGSLDDVFSFLGIIDEDSLNRLLTALVNKDLPVALGFVDRMAADGKDLGVLLGALIEQVRHLLLAKISAAAFDSLSEVSPRGKQIIADLSKCIASRDILRLIDLLIEAKTTSKLLNTVRIPFELALIKFAYSDAKEPAAAKPFKKTEAAEIKDKKENPSSRPVPSILAPQGQVIDDFDLNIDDFDSGDTAGGNLPLPLPLSEAVQPPLATDNEDDDLQPASGQSNSSLNDDTLYRPVKAKWQDIIKEMQKSRAGLASHVSFALPVSSRGSMLMIAFAPADAFHKEVVETAKNMQFVQDSIAAIIGKSVGVKFTLQELPEGAIQRPVFEKKSKTKDSGPADNAASHENDEYLNELFDTFGGQYHSE